MKKATVLRALLPLALLAGGVLISKKITSMAPTAERKAIEKAVAVVETLPLTPSQRVARITATGVVTPAQEVSLIPQVSGQVVYVSKHLVPGGRVKKGELLVHVDPSDYKLAVEQQAGSLRSAELQIELEQAQRELAVHEWQVMGEEGKPSGVFSRESQLEAAKANLGSGQRGLDRAKLNLSRTVLHAPFDATVVSKSVDRGQVVGPQSQLAQLMGTGELWVMVRVPVEELELLRIPDVNATEGSPATVIQRLANGKTIERSGHVLRLVDKLDERTRRAQVVVTIADAFSKDGGLPLLAGAYVEVAIEGAPFERAFQIPRQALYEGNVVWVMQPGDTLAKRVLEIAWGDAANVYATGGLQDGDLLVLTRLSAPIEGMAVRRVEEAAADSSAPKAPPSASSAAPPPGAAGADATKSEAH